MSTPNTDRRGSSSSCQPKPKTAIMGSRNESQLRATHKREIAGRGPPQAVSHRTDQMNQTQPPPLELKVETLPPSTLSLLPCLPLSRRLDHLLNETDKNKKTQKKKKSKQKKKPDFPFRRLPFLFSVVCLGFLDPPTVASLSRRVIGHLRMSPPIDQSYKTKTKQHKARSEKKKEKRKIVKSTETEENNRFSGSTNVTGYFITPPPGARLRG